jgi:hypothetical protein
MLALPFSLSLSVAIPGFGGGALLPFSILRARTRSRVDGSNDSG